MSEEVYFNFLRKGLALASEYSTVITPAFSTSREQLLFLLSDTFNDCIAYLEGRRIIRKTFEINSEYELQDLLFLMLKPFFPDFSFEDPSPKTGSSFAIKDFYIPSLKLVLEAKYIGSRNDVKTIERQLADDIWKYSSHPDCMDLVFFIFDRNFSIADRKSFSRSMTRKKGEFLNKGREIRIETIIRP